jgi:hypothetical protein
MSLDLSQFLNEVRNATTFEQAQRGLYQMLNLIQDHVNNGFAQVGVTSAGKVDPPDPPEKLDVTADNGTVHAVITHNAPIQKNIRYYVEASANDPSFRQPHVFDLGSGRSLFAPLPTKDDNGTDINWHFRSYAQYQGSKSSEPINFGEKYNPTPIVVGGATQFTPMASTGSGTAPANGQLAGQGLGNDFQRSSVAVARGVKSA